MAGDVNKELSRLLALKLQDPVEKGDEDTLRISALSRLDYLRRGLLKLIRILNSVYPELSQTILSKYIATEILDVTNSGVITGLNSLELYKIYFRRETDEEFCPVKIISPEYWIDVLTGQNMLYVPDLDKKRYFAAEVNGRLEIIPATKGSAYIHYLKSPDILSFTANDIKLAEHYWDLLLSFSASEYYLDLGEHNFFNSFSAECSNQLQILVNMKNEKEKNEAV